MCKKSTLIARTHRDVTLASCRPRGCKREEDKNIVAQDFGKTSYGERLDSKVPHQPQRDLSMAELEFT